MSKFKKLIAVLLTVLTLTTAGVSTVSVSAANRNSYNCTTSYTHYKAMRLTNKRKSGQAIFRISCVGSGAQAKVKLTDGNGRWLWESNLGFKAGYQYFYLGNDHTSYRFYFKKATSRGGVGINFVGGSNITT